MKKNLSFFVLIFAVFLPSFSCSCTTWHGLTQVSSKSCMCSISTPHKTRMFTVRLAGNGHGFAVAVLALAMPLDHPHLASTVLRISLNPGAQKATLNFFLNYHIWSSDCHWIPNLLLYTKLHQNWFTRSASRRPKLLNVQCAIARQRPSPWQPHHGGDVGDTIGCNYPSFIQIGSLVSELYHFQHFPIWRPSAILNFKMFYIWSRDCHRVPNLLL